MPETACIDIYHTQANGGVYDWNESRTAKYRQGALLPYINLSTLKENPSLLFALLYFRTQYSFEEWASFDMYQFRDHWKVGLLAIEFSPLCVAMHGHKYGEIVPFQEAAVHRGDIVGFPRARLLLESQSTLTGFLKRIIEVILEGANLNVPASAKWSAMCQNQECFNALGEVAEWSTYTYQPFSSPPELDIDSVIATAKSRFQLQADHLALLQTDHSYFRRYIRLVSQISQTDR